VISHPGDTLTLLFTDLVDSTAVSNRLGDDAAQALRRAHDRILREQFEAHGGTVIKGTGDGFFVTFPSARQGVECAAAIQRAIAAQQAEGRYPELSVRIGLNTGEPVVEGDDLFGADVTLAARIMAEAQGSEVLVSEVTGLLVRQHNFKLEPAGERTLKGFLQPVPVYRLHWLREADRQRRQSRFVGRVDEQARLQTHVDALFQGSGGLVLVAGEPGIGKTRLATELATFAQDRGARILSGRAFETEGLPPYFPIADALIKYLRTRSQPDLDRLIGQDAPYVYRVLPDLRPSPDGGEPFDASSDSERYLLFEAIRCLFARLTEESSLVLLLDDLHWADHATIHLLEHIVRSLSGLPLLIVATYREVELGDAHPLHNLAAEIARRGPGECIVLQPLSKDDTAVLVEDILGQRPDASVADELYSTAEGNPFFTEELVRSLTERATRTAEQAVPATTIPQGVRQVVLQRLSLLSNEVTTLLPHWAVLGHSLTPNRVAAVTARTESEVLDRFEEALDGRVLRETGDGFAFGHPLIRETIYQSMALARRRQLHREVGVGLEKLYLQNGQTNTAELAHHFLEAAVDEGGATKALNYAAQAADLAMNVFAYEDAGLYHQQALSMLDRVKSSDQAARCSLLLALADARLKAGDAPAADATFLDALRLARESGSAESIAEAALGIGMARRAAGIVDRELIEVLEEALRKLPPEDGPLRARVLSRYASAYAGPPSEQRAVSDEALAMAQRLGDPNLLSAVMMTALFVNDRLDLKDHVALAERALALAESTGLRSNALYARQSLISGLIEQGNIERADDEIRTFSNDAERLRQPFYLWLAAVFRGMRALLAGKFEEAERLAQAALAIGQDAQSGTNLAFQFFSIQLFAIRWEQGKLAELTDVVKSFVEQYPALRWRVGLAFLYAETGDEAAARAELQHIFKDGLLDVPDDANQVISLTFLAEICARLGDAECAASVYPRLSRYDGRTGIIGSPAACVGAVARSLGLLAHIAGRWEEAERHFETALAMNRRMGALPFVARTGLGYAKMLGARAAPGDFDRAARFLTEATEIAELLGMSRLQQEIDELSGILST
jgi:class 3 adenylate cyclase/tetratricopeptide (TPR) repeat protein